MEANITRYPYDLIMRLAENFDAVLDEKTINYLLQIKRDNKFIKRNNPLRLKYKLGDGWRNANKFDDSELSNEDKYNSLIISNLNKLTINNYDSILKEILETLELYNIIKIQVFVDLIFQKSIDEQIYSNIYSKLLADVLDIFTDTEYKTYLTNKCNEFYTDNINNDMTIKEINIGTIMDYNDLCDKFREKAMLLGGFIMISNLFNYNLVSYDMVLNYYNGLKSYVTNAPKDTVGIYIDTISSILISCGKALKKHNKENFNKNFLDIAISLSKDKERIIAKYRFKLLDVIELVNKNWEN
jgi:hypothetical protein